MIKGKKRSFHVDEGCALGSVVNFNESTLTSLTGRVGSESDTNGFNENVDRENKTNG
jgi:hypothetical protein